MKLEPQHHMLCRWNWTHECQCGLNALLAKLADRERRIRLARRLPMFTDDQWDELRAYARHYLDERRVIGEWYTVARAARAMFEIGNLLDLRRPLSRRTRSKR